MLTILAGAALVATMMAILWAIGWRINNMSLVDPGWAIGLALLGILYAALSDAPIARRLLIAILPAAWGARLAAHLYARIVGHPEEGRYQELRRRWAPRERRAFFVFFQAQALLDLILSAPFFLAARNDRASLAPLERIAPVLFVVAVFGETIADRQLAQWKRRPDAKGRTCREGLWRYSRHPNYFFEWLVWIAFALLALPAPHGWVALACPVIMLLLLFRVTGIPATEAQALRSRGDDYREYQRTTSVFVPWFPKRG
jgi:steroid 5-alpha reductase family enzyme